MNPLQQDKFEREWFEAFDGAKSEPSAGLWDKIENDLISAENKKLKSSLTAQSGIWL